jgi:hypothetical protein
MYGVTGTNLSKNKDNSSVADPGSARISRHHLAGYDPEPTYEYRYCTGITCIFK